MEEDLQAALARKLRNQTGIFTDEEVAFLTSMVLNTLKDSFGDNPHFAPQSTEKIIRWSSLRARCEREREKRGLSLKDVSARLKIPQYKLKAIEYGELETFEPVMAKNYFHFLGIERWVARWRRANRELAEQAGLFLRTTKRREHKKRHP